MDSALLCIVHCALIHSMHYPNFSSMVKISFVAIILAFNSACSGLGFHPSPVLSSHSANHQRFIRHQFTLAAAKIKKSDAEWKEILNPEQYYVLREEGTERPWSSSLNDVKDDGTFCCAGCGAPLYTTSTKYEVRLSLLQRVSHLTN